MITEKGSEFETPPPGAGFATLRFSIPGDARFAAGMMALRVLEFTNVVGIPVVASWTAEACIKFEPVNVTGVSPLPCTTELGVRAVKVGIGFAAVAPALGS
jgi:hypothetical protein